MLKIPFYNIVTPKANVKLHTYCNHTKIWGFIPRNGMRDDLMLKISNQVNMNIFNEV